MAKRKLSSEQRVSLREDLKKGIAAKKKVADLLREVAKKYGITTITARWYLKSIDGAPKRKPKSKAKSGRGPGRPPGRRPGRPLGSVSVSGLVKQVEDQAAKSREASKIVPRWQTLVDRETVLRRKLLKVEARLEATSAKAGKLRSQIEELVGR
jgi:hypothetical protein